MFSRFDTSVWWIDGRTDRKPVPKTCISRADARKNYQLSTNINTQQHAELEYVINIHVIFYQFYERLGGGIHTRSEFYPDLMRFSASNALILCGLWWCQPPHSLHVDGHKVVHKTCEHNCTVDRRLVVCFCDEPHYCNQSYCLVSTRSGIYHDHF